MIRIGYNIEEKRNEIQNYLDQHPETDRIYVFHGDKEPPQMDFDGIETIYTEYPETEMYRTFYPLLGQPHQEGQDIPAITDKSLLIVDEFLVTKNRSDLKYNCTKHYLRVSDRHMVFNYFPMIDEPNDFMILMDMDHPDIYKGHSFDPDLIAQADLKGHRHLPDLSIQTIEITEKDKEKYEEKKEKLFDDLGQKDPNTIPRNLSLTAGDMKKAAIQNDRIYVARNARFKRKNVYPYNKAPEAYEFYLLDMNYRLKDFEKFLRGSRPKELIYIDTGLPVDKVFNDLLTGWYEKMEEFYEAADIH